MTVSGPTPRPRSSRMPVSPEDLLSFSPVGCSTSGWCRKAGGTVRPSSRASATCRPVEVDEIRAPDDERDALPGVVDGHGELVGPVAVAVADQEVAALDRGLLVRRPRHTSSHVHPAVVEPHAQAPAGVARQAAVAAASVVASPGRCAVASSRRRRRGPRGRARRAPRRTPTAWSLCRAGGTRPSSGTNPSQSRSSSSASS